MSNIEIIRFIGVLFIMLIGFLLGHLYLGFKPLNEYSKGLEAHLDKIHIIYIPKEIHRSIWHCLKTGLNMDEINKLAIKYLFRKEV